jgi:hypothetical protein
MSTLQFSLFFAALLFAYVLVHVRLARFESYLKEIAVLKLLNERLQGVSEVIERVRLDRVEEQLGRLHEDLVEIRDGTARLERTLHRDLSQTISVATPAAGGADGSSGERARAAIETRLLSLGYGELNVISDLSSVRLDEQYEIKVECLRDHMPHKGTVVFKNGSVVDVNLQSAAQSFP